MEQIKETHSQNEIARLKSGSVGYTASFDTIQIL